MIPTRSLRVIAVVLGLLAGLVDRAAAQLSQPQGVWCSAAISNYNGSILPGNADPALSNFCTVVPGCVVEIISVGSNGMAHVPNVNGSPSGGDSNLFTTFIGEGVTCETLGQFSTSFYPPPAVGTKLYGRVFNAPSLGQATYWGQSSNFTTDGSTVMDLSALGLHATTIRNGASFTASSTNGTAPLTVSFTDNSDAVITNRFWNFGDGSTTNFASANNPMHTYEAGMYNVTLIVSGPGGASTNVQSDYIVVNCPAITVSPDGANPTVLTGVTEGTAYSQAITASGGIGTYIYAKTSGTLPTGVGLSSGGVISGTPTAPGTYDFTVTVTDAEGCTGSQAYSLTIACPTVPVTASSSAPFFQGQYQIVQGQSVQLSATTVSGATAYNWIRSDNGFSASGQSVSDTPPVGSYTYTVTVPTSCGTAVGTTPTIVVLAADASGVPNSWKTEHGYSASTPSSTVGANGMTLLQSYLAGVNPTNAASVLDMESASVAPSGMMTVVWQSAQDGTTPTRLYDFYSLTEPYTDGASWSRIYSNIAPAGVTTSTNDDAAGVSQRFYRVTIAGHTDDVATVGIAGVQMLTLLPGANYISMSTTQGAPTLLSVLGTNQLPQGAFETTATDVDIWDQDAQAFLVNNARYWLDTGANGWKQHNTAAASNDVLLDPTKGFIVTIQAGQGSQTLYVPGFVPINNEIQTVQSNGYTVASSTYPQTISLINSGLSNAVTGGTSLNRSDNLLVFDPTTQLFDIRAWYYTGDSTWRDANAAIVTNQIVLQPGEAFLIQRRSRSTNLIWTNPVPYAVPLQGP